MCSFRSRDVKSSNVLLTRDGAAKVAYLGLSKMGGLLEDSSTSVDPVGTFNYVAPELLMAARCTSRVPLILGSNICPEPYSR